MIFSHLYYVGQKRLITLESERKLIYTGGIYTKYFISSLYHMVAPSTLNIIVSS